MQDRPAGPLLQAEAAATSGLAPAGAAKASRLASRLASEPAPGPAGALSGSLPEAVGRGDYAATERLLARIGPDDELDAEGRTPLAVAVLRADIRMIRLLLARGAQRGLADRSGQTPQDLARAGGNPAVLQAFGLP